MSEEKKKESKTRGSKVDDPHAKQRFENMIQEDSSDDGNEVKITRVGYVEMKKQKNKGGKKQLFKPVHCILIGGSLYWYKTPKDVEPISGCDLSGVEVDGNFRVNDRECFAVNDSEGNPLFIGYLTSESVRAKWVEDLVQSKSKDPSPFPVRTKSKVKKQNLVSRTKNKVVSSTATSTIGKKVMRAIVNEETTTLLSALKEIVKKDSKDDKKGDSLEKNIIKIAVKAYLIIENKKLAPDDFLRMDIPIRQAFELLSRCYSQRTKVSPEKLTETLERVESLFKESEEILTNLLAPFLTPKNLFKISSAFGCVADSVFLRRVFFDEDLEEDVEKLIDAMEYYTQFHYD